MVGHAVAARPTRSDHSTSGTCRGNLAQAAARYQSGRDPERSAIETLAGNTATNSAALAGPPQWRPAGCASSPAQASSAAPLSATNPALCGSDLGTIERKGPGRRKCNTPD